MDFTVKIKDILSPVSGENEKGSWHKQIVLVETLERIPRVVAVSFWGERMEALKSYQSGDLVKISVNLESRLYNDRWYTEVKAWKIERVGGN